MIKRHLNPATVIACIALFVAMGGAAVAAKTAKVKTQNLANGAVTKPKLRNGAVVTAKLRNKAVTGVKIADGTIGSGQLAGGSVRSGQLGGGVVTEAKLKSSAVSEDKIKDGAVSSGKLASNFLGQIVRNVSYADTSSAETSEQDKSITAYCPNGKNAIAGGVRLNGELENVAVTGSTPFAEGSNRTGWSGFAHETGVGPYNDWSITAFVVCAEL